MRYSHILFLLLISLLTTSGLSQPSNNNCSNAIQLCRGANVTGTTQGATTEAGEPVLACGDLSVDNNVWYKVDAWAAGSVKIQVSNIDSIDGLEMEIYSGVCGALIPIGSCGTGIGPAGTISLVFPVVAGTTYYIMVDGGNAETEEFDISATINAGPAHTISGAPLPAIDVSPGHGCVTFCDSISNNTPVNGQNMSYIWSVKNMLGSVTIYNGPGSGADTVFCFDDADTYEIKLLVTNECGISTTSQIIGAQELLTPIVHIPDPVCFGTVATFTVNSSLNPNFPTGEANETGWQWNFGDPASGGSNTSTDENPTHTFIGTGDPYVQDTFQVSVIVSADCGPDTGIASVIVLAKPIIDPNGPLIICEGGIPTLTTNPSNVEYPVTYLWSGGGGIINTPGDSTTTVTGLTAGVYTFDIDITDNNGCIADSVVDVTVDPLPTGVADSTSADTICQGSTVNIYSTIANGLVSWTTNGAGSFNDPTDPNPVYTADSTDAGTICFYLAVNGAPTCAPALDTLCVVVIPGPTVDAGTDNTICVGGAHTLADAVATNGAISWSHDGSGTLNDSTIQNPTYTSVAGDAGMTVSLILTVTNANCAAVSDTIELTVDPTPIAVVDSLASDTVCEGTPITVYSTVANGSISWTHSGAGTLNDSTVADPVYTPDIGESGTVCFYLIVTGAPTCPPALDTICGVINAAPFAEAGPNDSICEGQKTTFSGAGYANGSPLWTHDGTGSLDNNMAINPTYTHGLGDPGTTVTFILTVSNPPCPDAVDTTYRYFIPGPVANIDSAASDSMCQGGTLALYSTPANGTITWTTSGAGSFNDNSIADPIYTADPGESGIICFYQQVIAGGVCSPAFDTICVQVQISPTAFAGADISICPGESILLADAIATNGSISWSHNGAGSLNDNSIQNPTYISTVGEAGSVVTLIMTVSNPPCADMTDTVEVSVNSFPSANSSALTPMPVCAYGPVTLISTPTPVGNGPFTYYWSPSGLINDTTLASPTAMVPSDTCIYIYVEDAAGCRSLTDSVCITVFPKPIITPSPGSICESDTSKIVTFSVSGAGAGSMFAWNLSPAYSYISGANADSSVITCDFGSATTGIYVLTVIVNDGITMCTDTVSINFTIDPPISVTVNGPFTICEGEMVSLSVGGGGLSYLWTAIPADPSLAGQETLTDPDVTPTTTTSYIAVGTAGACTASDTVLVTVNPKPLADIAPIPDVCGCDTVMLDGSGSTPAINYAWTSALGQTIENPTGMVTAAYLCSGDVITLIVTNPVTDCGDTTTTLITQTPNPVIAGFVTPLNVCSNVPTVVTLDGTGSDVSPGTTYLWTANPISTIADSSMLVTTATITGATSFTLTVTDILGCDTSIVVNAGAFPIPNISFSPPGICTSEIPPLESDMTVIGAGVGSTYEWYLSTYYGLITASNGDSSTVTATFPVLAGTYDFTVVATDGITGCADTVTNSVLIADDVTLARTPDTTICEGDNLVLKASGGATYLWGTGATTDSIIVSPPLAAGIHTYGIIGYIGGCSDTDTVIVTVLPLPSITFLSNDTSLCFGDTATLMVSGGFTTIWSSDPIDPSLIGQETQGVVMVNPISSTNYTVTISDVTATCFSSDVVYVNVNSLPSVAITASEDTVCSGDNTTLVGSGATTYFWSSNPADPSLTPQNTAPNPTVVPTVTTEYYVTGTDVTTGCSNGDTIMIVVNPLPVVIASSIQDTICVNDSTKLVASGAASYTWAEFSNPSVIIGTDDTITVAPFTTTCYILTGTDAEGCSNIDIVCLVVNQPPVAYAGIGGTICQGDSIVLFTASSTGQVGWTVSPPGAGVFSNPNLTSPYFHSDPTFSGLATLTMTASSAPCADSISSVDILVEPAPFAIIDSVSNDTICQSTPLLLHSTAFNGTILWTTSGSGIFNDVAIADPAYTPGVSDAGTICFYLSVMDVTSLCPFAGDTICVEINPVPTSNIISSGPDTLCQGDTVLLSANATNGTILWTSTGSGTFGDPASASTYYIPNTETGDITLTLTASSYPCTDAISSTSIHVYETPSVILSPSDTTICFQDIIVITSAVTGNPPINYSWSPGGETTPSITVSPSDTTTYSLNISNNFQCGDATSITVNVIPPGVAIAGSDQFICVGDNADLTGSIQNASNALWSSNGSGSFSPDNTSLLTSYIPSNADTLAGVVEIYLNSTDACINLADTIVLSIGSIPVANCGATGEVALGAQVPLNGSVIFATGGVWTSNGTGSFYEDPSDLNAIYFPSNEDLDLELLTFTLSTVGGCRVESCKLEVSFADVVVPNVMSPFPSSPGYNDHLRIAGLPEGAQLLIFNRWGLKVFQSDHYQNDWDGEGLDSNVYYYILTFKNRSWNGFIQLIR